MRSSVAVAILFLFLSLLSQGCQDHQYLSIAGAPAETAELRVRFLRAGAVLGDWRSLRRSSGSDDGYQVDGSRLRVYVVPVAGRSGPRQVEVSALRADGCRIAAGSAALADIGQLRESTDVQLAAATDPLCLPAPPVACPANRFCWANPLPSGGTIKRIWADGPNRMWAIGDNALVLRYDGARWVDLPPLPSDGGPPAHLYGLWGSEAAGLWVAGYSNIDNTEGLVARFANGTWTIVKKEVGYFPTSLCGNAHGVFVGQRRLSVEQYSAQGAFLKQRLLEDPIPEDEGTINDVFCEPDVVWAGGTYVKSRIGLNHPLQWGLWRLPSATGAGALVALPGPVGQSAVHSIWRNPAGRMVLAGYEPDLGPALLVRKGDGEAFTINPLPNRGPTGGGLSLWGLDPESLWTSNGYAFRVAIAPTGNDASFQQEALPKVLGEHGIYALGGTDENDLWAAGEGGQVFHRTATGWTWARAEGSAFLHFTSVIGDGEGGLWLAADLDGVFHFDPRLPAGAQLRQVSNNRVLRLYNERGGTMLGLSYDGVRRYSAKGEDLGTVFSRQGFSLTTLWTDGSGEIWAGGVDSRLIHNGQIETLPADFRLTGLWGRDASDVWAVGATTVAGREKGAIYNRQGGQWRSVDPQLGDLPALYAILGTPEGEITIRSAEVLVGRRDGKWSLSQVPGTCKGDMQWGTGMSDLWLGSWRRMCRHSSRGWSFYNYPANGWSDYPIKGAYSDGQGTTWFAGEYGTLLSFRGDPAAQ